MKKLLIVILLWPCLLFGQEVSFNITTDTTWVETTGSGTIATVKYIWTDTVIYSQDQNERILKSSINKEVLDSITLVNKLYGLIKENYDYYGIYEASKVNFLQKSNFYRKILTNLFGEDNYRFEVVGKVRANMAGRYAFRYNNVTTILTQDELGRFRDSDNNLILINNPLSSYWIVVINRDNNNESMQFFTNNKELWRGEGELGIAILRKLD